MTNMTDSQLVGHFHYQLASFAGRHTRSTSMYFYQVRYLPHHVLPEPKTVALGLRM